MPYTEEQIKSFERDQIAGKNFARYLHRVMGESYNDRFSVHGNATVLIQDLLAVKEAAVAYRGFTRGVRCGSAGPAAARELDEALREFDREAP